MYFTGAHSGVALASWAYGNKHGTQGAGSTN